MPYSNKVYYTTEDELNQLAGCIQNAALISTPLTFPDGFIEGIENAIDLKTIIENGNEIFPSYYENSTITSIAPYAFAFNGKFLEISFPNCTTIEEGAFKECSSLQSISFLNCTTIENGAFDFCSVLQSVYFPNCTTIGSYAFDYCYSLQTVSFPNCTAIEKQAFQGCSSLQSVFFPNCTMIGDYVFNYCSSLQSVYILGSSVATLSGTSAFQYSPISSSSYLGRFGSIFVPASLVNAYKTATNWATYAARIVGV